MVSAWQELSDCFEWSEPHANSAVPFLREALAAEAGDDAAFDASRRLLLLRWCTGLNALPVSGLSRKVTFENRKVPAGSSSTADAYLPEAHTCSHEVSLPAYSSKAALLAKLEDALDDFAANAGFGQE